MPVPLSGPGVESGLFCLFAQGGGQVPFYLHLPILLVVTSLVYSATRFEDWGLILREAFRWGIRLLAFLLAIVLVLYVLASFI